VPSSCRVYLSPSQLAARKAAGDAEWPVQELTGLDCETIKCRVPDWVAERFRQHSLYHQAGSKAAQPPAAAPPAAAPSVAAGQDSPGQVTGSSSGVAPQHPAAHAAQQPVTQSWPGHSSSTVILPDTLPGIVQQSVPAVTAVAASTQVPAPTPGTVAAATAATAGAAAGAVRCGGSADDLLNCLPTSSSCSSYDSTLSSSSQPVPADDPMSSADGPAAPAQAAAAAGNAHAAYITMSTGIDSWVKQGLHPSKAECSCLGVVLDVVQQALSSKAVGEVWSVIAMHPVGSFSRKTSLRSS
jgi:hypothetical protein